MIKILFHYDCFNKNSGCLHTTPFMGNFDGISVFLQGYKLFWTSSCSFELVVGGLIRWLEKYLGGWLQMVSGGLLF